MVSIKDMSLKKKLIGGFALMVLLLGIVGYVGYKGISKITNELHYVNTISSEAAAVTVRI
jgi:CHASE3 domain sensor protein